MLARATPALTNAIHGENDAEDCCCFRSPIKHSEHPPQLKLSDRTVLIRPLGWQPQRALKPAQAINAFLGGDMFRATCS